MSIRNKIIFAFLLMSAFLITQSLVSVRSNMELDTLVSQAIEKNYQALTGINALSNDIQKLRRYEKEYFIYIDDVMKKGQYARQWQATFEHAQARLDGMIENASGIYQGEDTARFSTWRDALQFYGTAFSAILERYKMPVLRNVADAPAESTSIQANAEIHAGKSQLGKALEDAAKMGQTKTQESLAVAGEVKRSFQQVKMLSLALTAGAIILALLLIFIIPGGIDTTLKRLLGDAERISRDDLSRPVERSPVAEFDSLAVSLENIRKAKLALSQRQKA
jgi:CHASE3 domain sensor protein